MAEKLKKNLLKRIGKLPEKWEKMTLEEKVDELYKKWYLLNESDMYELEIHCDPTDDFSPLSVWFELSANEDHQFTEDGACFALKKPVKKKDFDISKFPEYLHKFMESQADEDWKTDEKDFNMLYSEAPSGNFEQAVENMYFYLDLLTCGYELTEREWFKEAHPDLYPDDEDLLGDDEE